LAREHGLSPVELALGFVYKRWCVGSTIIGATTMEQLQQDIDAAEVSLSNDILDEIERIHLTYTNPAP